MEHSDEQEAKEAEYVEDGMFLYHSFEGKAKLQRICSALNRIQCKTIGSPDFALFDWTKFDISNQYSFPSIILQWEPILLYFVTALRPTRYSKWPEGFRGQSSMGKGDLTSSSVSCALYLPTALTL